MKLPRHIGLLVDTIHIEVPPSRVFDWLRALPTHYSDWHPDHRVATWERGRGLEPGAVLRAEERLHGKRHVVRSRLVSIEPDRDVTFASLWPTSLLSPGGSFHVEPEGTGCRFTHTLRIRWPALWAWLAPRRPQLLTRHMREEGENLKRILEESAP